MNSGPGNRNSLKVDAEILDFNDDAYRTKYGTNQRFSLTRAKQSLKLADIEKWVEQIDFPQTKHYSYPANLDKAILHQQSCYLQPDLKFLINTKENQCECCGNKLVRKRFSVWSSDCYEIFAKENGLAIPIYFTIQKLHITILSILFLIYGIPFCYLSYHFCSDQGQFSRYVYFIVDSNEQPINQCEFATKSPFFASQYFMIQILQNLGYGQLYLWFCFFVFLLILTTPFIHEVIIKTRLVQYWNYDIQNHRKASELTLYIKHLPEKYSDAEILKYILHALQSENKMNPNNNSYIDELVYIYDTHPIANFNRDREIVYLRMLQSVNKLRADPKDDQAKEQLIDQILDLMKLTKKIQAILKMGLPFTSKVIIKFQSKAITSKVYAFYDKGFLGSMFSQFKQIEQQAKKEEFKVELMLSSSEIVSPSTSQLKAFRTNSIEMEATLKYEGASPEKTAKKKLGYSLAELVDFRDDEVKEMQSSQKLHPSQAKKGLHMQRGFSQDDIYWENMGMHTLKRFILRFKTTAITILAGLLTMGIFLYCFYKEQKLKSANENIDSLKLDILLVFMLLIIVFASVASTIIVVKMTINAKRSAYSLQEKNMIAFMSPIQQVCVVGFPYFLALSPSFTSATVNCIFVYTLFFIALFRISFKAITNVFHIRVIGAYCRRKKVLRNFKGTKYYQKQLNQLMTPALYPMRSRVLYSFFIFSSGLLLTFLSPSIMVFCLAFQIFFFFFDKYALMHTYLIDRQYTYHLLNYTVIVYQVVMIPIYTYVYARIFAGEYIFTGDQFEPSLVSSRIFLWLAIFCGSVCFLLYVTVRKRLAQFWVHKIWRYPRQVKNPGQFQEKTYFQSYTDYFDGLGIEDLNNQLINTFKNMQCDD